VNLTRVEGDARKEGLNKFNACQPLVTLPPSVKIVKRGITFVDDAYIRTYLEKAWRELLQEGYNGVKVKDPIEMPEKEGDEDRLPDMIYPDLGANQVERIIDPSHPFSPRHRTDGEVWEKYAVAAVAHSPVVCAPTRIDILEHRSRGFDMCIIPRIAKNAACWADRGMWPKPGCGDIMQMTGRQACSTITKGDLGALAKGITKGIYSGGVITGKDPCDLTTGFTIEECCKIVTDPFVPLNVLKIRDESELPKGAAEGMRFKDYFGKRRPYPRRWDTGTAVGDIGQPHNLLTTKGADVAIVGVGRDGGGESGLGETCGFMGAGGKGSGAITVANPDPVLSWTELKAYQMNTERVERLVCLGQYNKLFKYKSAEEYALGRGGASYISMEEDNEGRLLPVSRMMPLGWRGYVADTASQTRFPNLFKEAQLITGLDNAKEGDIMIYDTEVQEACGKPHRLPFISFVTSVNKRQGIVRAQDWNTGRNPDVCGMTDRAARGTERTMYKNSLPEPWKGMVAQIEKQKTETCDDPLMRHCQERCWDKVKLYRPKDDIREGGILQ
jgi:hypothetical protein